MDAVAAVGAVPPRLSWRRAAALGAVVAVAAGAVLGVAATRPAAPPWPTGAEVQAYQDAVYPLAEEWGRVEMQGMRPAIGDLLSGEGVPPETVGGEARHWGATFERIRYDLARVPAPDRLAQASALFDRALAEYIEAARLFEAAAAVDGEARRGRVDAGIERARGGARLYNEASMALQAARRSAGLGVTDLFPNAPAER